MADFTLPDIAAELLHQLRARLHRHLLSLMLEEHENITAEAEKNAEMEELLKCVENEGSKSEAQRKSSEYKKLLDEMKKILPKFSSKDIEMWNKLDQELLSIASEISNLYIPRDSHTKPKRTTYESVINASNRYSTVDPEDYCDYEKIRSVLLDIHKKSHNTTVNSKDDVVPILNIVCASLSDIRTLLSLFVSDISESATKEELLVKLSKFIPTATVKQKPVQSSQKPGACYQCGSVQYPLVVHQYPRLGWTNPHSLCSQCIADITKEDADDWGGKSMKLLAKNDTDSITASLGCTSVALALGANPHVLLQRMAKELQKHGHFEVATNLISPLLANHDAEISNNQQLKLHLLASSLLKNLAQGYQKSLEEKLSLAVASQEAYTAATKIAAKCNIEIGGNREQEIENLVHQLCELKVRKHNDLVSQYTRKLELLWMQKDVHGMLSFLKNINGKESGIHIGKEDPSLEALQNFITRKEREPFITHEDHDAIRFLKCVLDLKEKEVDAALADLESVAWNSVLPIVPREAILSVYLHVLEDQKSELYSYAVVKDTLKLGSSTLLFSQPAKIEEKSKHLFFPTDSELNPPFKRNWPYAHSAVGNEGGCHSRYETAILKKYNEKKWTEMDVAWAYIDEIQGCKYPPEMVVCHLHAAMWMAKQLNPQSKIDASTLNGLKCVIMKLLKTAFSIALNFSNSGMQLYVNRLVIGIMRKIALMSNSKLVLNDEDIAFLKIALKKLIKLSQLFPFWEPPSIPVSEAIIFEVITENLHSNFIFGLQSLSPEQRPLSSTDLQYQLYENDVKRTLCLKNPSDSRARAMEALLQSQSRSWNEVIYNMSSFLTQRDEEGWYIQSPDFRVPQQYYELTGFVIDATGLFPSIQLLVVEADPRNGKMGLFSKDDINTMVQLDGNQMHLYFSLDPPDHDFDKRFHPFQQWRYGSEKIKGTEVLKTMFTADYLMKSFTVGSDISAKPPFEQRSCKEGLTKNLPSKLQEAIRSIPERGGIQSQDSAYRFWIEAKEMKFSLEQEGSKIECHFGEMEMIVKCHSLARCNDGKFVDAEYSDPDSPEAQFAKDMTENYTELSHYFPVFARLRQLSKLQEFVNMKQKVLDQIKKGINPTYGYIDLHLTQSNTCQYEWVPAALSQSNRYTTYGGVTFNPKLIPLQRGERLPWFGNAIKVAIPKSDPVRLVSASQTSYASHPTPKASYSTPGGYSAPVGNAVAKRPGEGSKSDGNSENGSSGGSAPFAAAGLAAAAAATLSSDDEQDGSNFVIGHIKAITSDSTSSEPIISGVTFRQKNPAPLNDKLDNFLHSFRNETEARQLAASSQPTKPPQPQLSKRQSKPPGGGSKPPGGGSKPPGGGSKPSGGGSKPPGGGSKPPGGGSKPPGGGSKPPGGGSKPPGGGSKPPGGGSGGGSGGDPASRYRARGRGFITGCDDEKFKSCRSPNSIIPHIVQDDHHYSQDGPDRKITSRDRINGLYVLVKKKAEEIMVYIGRSCDVLRRITQHKNDIMKGRKTVGKFFSSVEDMEFCIIPLPQDSTTLDMRFEEQRLLSKAESSEYKVINKIRAMGERKFQEEANQRGILDVF